MRKLVYKVTDNNTFEEYYFRDHEEMVEVLVDIDEGIDLYTLLNNRDEDFEVEVMSEQRALYQLRKKGVK